MTLKKAIKTMVEIPIIGTIAAGAPIDVFEDYQGTVAVSNPNIKDSKDVLCFARGGRQHDWRRYF
jgi:SOS-response transcriptional repressor LexA